MSSATVKAASATKLRRIQRERDWALRVVRVRGHLDRAARELTLAHETAEEAGHFMLAKRIRTTRRRIEALEATAREVSE